MKPADQVKCLCVVKNVSVTALSKMIDKKNLPTKLKRGNLNTNELTQIANALGATYVQYFELPNGEIIK